MTYTLKYLWLTLKHKVFVFRAGLRTKAPIFRLLIHDWSKFTFAEAPHYGRQFFGPADEPLNFSKAWLHHQNINPHHWEYWVPRTQHNRGGLEGALPMPEWAVREMVADWLGASRAYEGSWPKSIESWTWLQQNLDKITVHSDTKKMINQVLKEVFEETR